MTGLCLVLQDQKDQKEMNFPRRYLERTYKNIMSKVTVSVEIISNDDDLLLVKSMREKARLLGLPRHLLQDFISDRQYEMRMKLTTRKFRER